MEEAPENGKESSNSAHANGKNEGMDDAKAVKKLLEVKRRGGEKKRKIWFKVV